MFITTDVDLKAVVSRNELASASRQRGENLRQRLSYWQEIVGISHRVKRGWGEKISRCERVYKRAKLTPCLFSLQFGLFNIATFYPDRDAER